MILLNLPYPPSVNAYWLTSGRRKFLSKRGREFKQAVQEYVIDNKIPKLGSKAVSVEIILRPRSKKLMDIDNCAKAVLDSLQDAGVFDNDQQVWKLTIERGIPRKGGGAVVMIFEYPLHSPGESLSGQLGQVGGPCTERPPL